MPDSWKQRIVEIESEEAVRFEAWRAIMPPAGGCDVVPRVIRTEFVAAWRDRAGEAAEHADELRDAIMGSVRRGTPDELTPFAGQTAGLVREVLAAGHIVRTLVAEAEGALWRAPRP